MAEIALITVANVGDYGDLSPNVNSDKFAMKVTQIQRNYLRKLLGKEMYYDLFDKVTDIDNIAAPYDDLVNGTDYTLNSEKVEYYGLKPYLSYLFLNEYTLSGDSYHSDYGNVVLTDNPQDLLMRASYREKQDLQNLYKQNAAQYEGEIRDFINTNSSDYPLWQMECIKNDWRDNIIVNTLK